MDQEMRAWLESRAKAYGINALAEKSKITRQTLNNFFRGGDIKLSTLKGLLECLGWSVDFSAPEASTKTIMGNLKNYGAPLITEAPEFLMSLEETLDYALHLSREDSRVATVIPYFLVENTYRLNMERLLFFIQKDKTKCQLLGYFLEVALSYRYRAPLDEAMESLKKISKKKGWLYLRKSDEGRHVQLYQHIDNKPAKNWNILTRDQLDDLLFRYKKWEQLDEAS